MIFRNQNSACCKWFWWKQTESLDKNNDYHCRLQKGARSKGERVKGDEGAGGRGGGEEVRGKSH